MSDEVGRCQKRLSMRVVDKCVFGTESTESDEWFELKRDE